MMCGMFSGLVTHPMSRNFSRRSEVFVHAEHTQCQHTNQIIEDTESCRLISNDMHHVPSMSIPKMVDSTRSPLQIGECPESLYLVKHPYSLDLGY